MSYNRSVGAQGERDAADFFVGRGAKILDMNFHCPQGEIDLVAQMDGTLVFCEVKRRSSMRYGRPAAAVTAIKQRRIICAAEVWLARNPQPDCPIRFDVLEVLPGEFRHIPGAFDASR